MKNVWKFEIPETIVPTEEGSMSFSTCSILIGPKGVSSQELKKAAAAAAELEKEAKAEGKKPESEPVTETPAQLL